MLKSYRRCNRHYCGGRKEDAQGKEVAVRMYNDSLHHFPSLRRPIFMARRLQFGGEKRFKRARSFRWFFITSQPSTCELFSHDNFSGVLSFQLALNPEIAHSLSWCWVCEKNSCFEGGQRSNLFLSNYSLVDDTFVVVYCWRWDAGSMRWEVYFVCAYIFLWVTFNS